MYPIEMYQHTKIGNREGKLTYRLSKHKLLSSIRLVNLNIFRAVFDIFN